MQFNLPTKSRLRKSDEEEPDDSDLLENNFDKDSRTVYLLQDITAETVCQCMKAFHVLDRTPGDVTLIINSEGGSTCDGWALIDFIGHMKNPVHGVVYGGAFSMASLLLQSCKTRSMTKHSILMLHAGSVSVDSDTNSAILNAEYLKRDLNVTMDYYRSRSKISPKKIKELMNQDSFMDATEALKYGLVDKII